ncbi:MAG: ATP-grasp domain-containing protein [Gemmatimonadota bacterium]|jgi:predicted ATP-grasp superfamily ATP-dependent carboligase
MIHMAQPTVPAVILSGNLGTPTGKWSINEPALALARSLGRRDVPVYRFHPDRSLVDLTSRYCTHVPCPNLYDDPAGLVEALVRFAGDHPEGKPVLYPASDGSAQFIADNERTLSDWYELTSPSADCIDRTQNKRRLIEAAVAAGVPVPETFFPSEASELTAIADVVRYPVVLKPLYSPDWKRPEVTSVFGRVKAIQVFGRDDLIENCRTLLSLSSIFMVQEIIGGPDENLLTFLGYMDRDGKPLAGCVRKKLRQYPPGFGYCCLTESVEDDEVFELSVGLLKALDYRGIGCIEFKRDPRTGVPQLIEINTRAVRTSALAIASGVDFPWIAYQDATRPGSVVPSLVAKVPVRWIHIRDELAAAGLLMTRGQLSPIRWLKGFLGKPLVAAEFSWDDIYPALLFWAQVPGKLIRRIGGGRVR